MIDGIRKSPTSCIGHEITALVTLELASILVSNYSVSNLKKAFMLPNVMSIVEVISITNVLLNAIENHPAAPHFTLSSTLVWKGNDSIPTPDRLFVTRPIVLALTCRVQYVMTAHRSLKFYIPKSENSTQGGINRVLSTCESTDARRYYNTYDCHWNRGEVLPTGGYIPEERVEGKRELDMY